MKQGSGKKMRNLWELRDMFDKLEESWTKRRWAWAGAYLLSGLGLMMMLLPLVMAWFLFGMMVKMRLGGIR